MTLHRAAIAACASVGLAAACANTNIIGADGTASTGTGGGQGSTVGGTTSASERGAGGGPSSSSASTGGGPCPPGVTCVSTFPFTDERDTSDDGVSKIDAYDCSPDTNESGEEIYYRVDVPSDGFLSVVLSDGAGVDIDVHILTDLDPAAPTGTTCVDRGDLGAKADVKAGSVWVVADSWSNGTTAFPGAFTIDIGFLPVAEGPCGLEVGSMPRVGDGGNHLAMPATGPIVMEAHLVTQAEPEPFPATETEELLAHFALSQKATGMVMPRTQVWAPMEGGSFFGAGIGDPADFPVLDEGWYVNMYWTAAARPPKGTRMILQKGDDLSRAVVVAAGYETGPGNLSNIGGTTEETHYYLGTEHHSVMKLGIATDQSLPLGPRKCKP